MKFYKNFFYPMLV